MIPERSRYAEKARKWEALRSLNDSEPLSYRLQAFHATSVSNWESIQARGLIPGYSDPSGQDWKGKWSGKATYFHQTLPRHELTNGNQDGFNVLVIEVRTIAHAGWIVPDEDVSLDVNYTPKAMQRHESIAYGYPVKPSEFYCLHLPRLPGVREWALENVRRPSLKIQFLDI